MRQQLAFVRSSNIKLAEAAMGESYFIRAIWDLEANVFYSDTNVPGLVVEAESLGEFVAIAEALLPEILAANVGKKVSSGRHLVAGAFEIAL